MVFDVIEIEPNAFQGLSQFSRAVGGTIKVFIVVVEVKHEALKGRPKDSKVVGGTGGF